MMKQFLSPFPLLVVLIFFIHSITTSAQSPAQAPAPPGPTNVTKVLEKAGQYTTFIRLLKSSQMADRLNTQLNNSNQGLTIFAPDDNAFASLKVGTLNSFTDQRKAELLQFHILPSVFSISQLQTISNPVPTLAGGSSNREFPLNITTNGTQVNITTGIVNATVASTIYTDDELAVYQVDQVLLPMAFYVTPAPAPAPSKPKKQSPARASSDDTPVISSGRIHSAINVNFFMVSVFAAVSLF